VGWVVKGWSSDGLERLLAERAVDGLRATREGAARDARRARRIADRAAAEAAAQLDSLEALGRELQLSVRAHRAALRTARGTVEPVRPVRPLTTAPPAPAAPPQPARGRRGERASMRSPAITELFRPTEPRGPSTPPR
jgi:hypothetical protein